MVLLNKVKLKARFAKENNMPDKNGIPTEKEIYDALMPKADDPRIQKKPVKVIKKGDMSPETKALPDEVVAPPKGIGESEKDMGPIEYKKKGGAIKAKKMASGGSVLSASKRADGIAVKGKTRGKIC
jgi:hypothetical protein